jgi:hypothetical protein
MKKKIEAQVKSSSQIEFGNYENMNMKSKMLKIKTK